MANDLGFENERLVRKAVSYLAFAFIFQVMLNWPTGSLRSSPSGITKFFVKRSNHRPKKYFRSISSVSSLSSLEREDYLHSFTIVQKKIEVNVSLPFFINVQSPNIHGIITAKSVDWPSRTLKSRWTLEFSYTTGRGVEGRMRLTVRLKDPEESFEPAVNAIPVPDAPGAKLDYDYIEVRVIQGRIEGFPLSINLVRWPCGFHHTDVGSHSRIWELDQPGADLYRDGLRSNLERNDELIVSHLVLRAGVSNKVSQSSIGRLQAANGLHDECKETSFPRALPSLLVLCR